MITNNLFLFIIITTLGIYLGNVQCSITREQFIDFEQKYFSGDGPPSTVFSVHDYDVKNTTCFFALLRYMVSKSDRTEGYEYFREHVLINIHLLRMNMYLRLKPKIHSMFRQLAVWQVNEVIKTALVKEILELIDMGKEINLWYLEKEYITERSKDNIILKYSDAASLFNECKTLYEGFKYSAKVLNLLEIALLKDLTDRQGRMEVFKTMPLKISSMLEVYHDGLDIENLAPPTIEDYRKMVHNTVYLYELFFIDVIGTSYNLICKVAQKNTYKVKMWNSETLQMYDETVKLHIDIIKGLSNKIEILECNIERLRKLGEFQSDILLRVLTFYRNMNELRKKYNPAMERVLNNQECESFVQHETSTLIFPSLLPYYKNYKENPNLFTNEYTKDVLQLQALTFLMTVNSEFLVTVFYNVGLRAYVVPLISVSDIRQLGARANNESDDA